MTVSAFDLVQTERTYRIRAGALVERLRLQQALEQVAGPMVLVLTSVPLADLLRVPAHTPDAHQLRTRLERRFADAVLVTRDLGTICAAVLLDQPGLGRGAFAHMALQVAGVPVLVLTAAEVESPNDLAARLSAFLPDKAESTIEVPVVPASVATPACPVCGAPMVLRRKLHGPDHGQRFWGCSAYPRTGCRGLRPALVSV